MNEKWHIVYGGVACVKRKFTVKIQMERTLDTHLRWQQTLKLITEDVFRECCHRDGW